MKAALHGQMIIDMIGLIPTIFITVFLFVGFLCFYSFSACIVALI